MMDWLDYFTRQCARKCLTPQATVQGSIAHKSLIVATHPAQIEGLSPVGWAQVRLNSTGHLDSSLTMSRIYHCDPNSASLDMVVCYELDLSIEAQDTSSSLAFHLFGDTLALKRVYNRHLAAIHPSYSQIIQLADGVLPPPRELLQKTIDAYVEISKG